MVTFLARPSQLLPPSLLQRCDTLLALLLPPTIASEVRSKKSARDLLEPGFVQAGGQFDPSHGISSLGEERYAESCSEASVLFAESACGTRRFFHPPPSFLLLYPPIVNLLHDITSVWGRGVGPVRPSRPHGPPPCSLRGVWAVGWGLFPSSLSLLNNTLTGASDSPSQSYDIFYVPSRQLRYSN